MVFFPYMNEPSKKIFLGPLCQIDLHRPVPHSDLSKLENQKNRNTPKLIVRSQFRRTVKESGGDVENDSEIPKSDNPEILDFSISKHLLDFRTGRFARSRAE